jgi:hypothetical protein
MARKPVKVSAKSKQKAAAPEAESHDDRIRRRAYQIWEEEGWPHGRDAEHWSRAEREIAPGTGPGPEPLQEEDRSRAVAPPKSRRRPGASAKLGGTPSAPAAGKGRGE